MKFFTHLLNQPTLRSFGTFNQRAVARILAHRASQVQEPAEIQIALDKEILRAAKVVFSDTLPEHAFPVLTPERWVFKLASFYYLTHFTPKFMRTAAQGFSKAKRFSLADWAERKAAEEAHHDWLALQDIADMGYEPTAVIKTLLPTGASRMVNYFQNCVESDDPIETVGYCYAMERIAMSIREEHIQSVAAMLPATVKATRCLQVHSAEGSDSSHVEETIEAILQLDQDTQSKIISACYQTAFLHFEGIRKEALSQQKLLVKLSPLKQQDQQIFRCA